MKVQTLLIENITFYRIKIFNCMENFHSLENENIIHENTFYCIETHLYRMKIYLY